MDSWGLPGGPRSDGTTKEGRRAGLHFPGVVGCGSAPYASPSMVVGRVVGSWRTCGCSRGDSCCDELHHRRVGSAPLQTSNLPSRNSRPCLWTTVRAVLSVGFGKPEQASPLTQKKNRVEKNRNYHQRKRQMSLPLSSSPSLLLRRSTRAKASRNPQQLMVSGQDSPRQRPTTDISFTTPATEHPKNIY